MSKLKMVLPAFAVLLVAAGAMADAQAVMPPANAASAAHSDSRAARAARIQQKMDANGDGTVSPEERAAFKAKVAKLREARQGRPGSTGGL